jgi:hypothetical protein
MSSIPILLVELLILRRLLLGLGEAEVLWWKRVIDLRISDFRFGERYLAK